MIDVPTAVSKNAIKYNTLRSWIHQRRIQPHGRMKGYGRGGGQTFVAEDELVDYMTTPRSVGGRGNKLTKST